MSAVQTGFADINGARMCYEVAGAGQPLVMLHAGIADSRMWDGQFVAFAEHYRVARCDLRGYGQTTAPLEGAYSHLEDLRALLEFLGIERAALMGCSKGGGIAMNFALTYPALTAALMMVCSGPDGFEFDAPPPPMWDELVAAFKAADLERTAELEIQLWLDGVGQPAGRVGDPARSLVRDMILIALRSEKQSQAKEDSLPPPPAAQRLSEIHAPMLVVVGDLDSTYILAAGDFMTAGIGGAKKVVITGTAHLPNLERPAEFNRQVLDFLGGSLA